MRKLPVAAWAMYDFANTIFSFSVVSFYFNDWLINQRHAPDWYVGATGLVVAVFLIATLTPLGAVADVLGRRKPFLIGFTIMCCTATAFLGATDRIAAALVLVAIANFCYQSALSHYDPLLAVVAPPERHGRVSGIGVGVGYLGTVLALPVLDMATPKSDLSKAFLPTAIMFFVFALPCFFFVREPGVRSSQKSLASVASAAIVELKTTAKNIRKYGSMGRFLLARFLYADALLTVIAYMTVYLTRVGGWESEHKFVVVMFSNTFAIAGAFASGFIVERIGPRRVIVSALFVFAPTLAVTGLIGTSWMMWIAGPITGATLGTIWTADRVLMLRLTPPEQRGEFFGVYNLVGKLSSGLGPLVLWGGTIWLLHSSLGTSALTASRAALGMLALATIVGCLIVRRVHVPDSPQQA